ncbi:MAG: sulfatase-like hydrolase/transferase [Bacteroidetes bacterium]|nr:sulfatase-like hydrolase/transferase [Bacteroidota bacterium]
MKKRVLLFVLYLLFWYLLFVLSRICFLLYHWDQSSHLSFTEALLTFRYGFMLDASMSAYISILPGLLLILDSFLNKRVFKLVIKYYTFVVCIVVTAIVVIDVNLYSYWGFRLDATPLFYMGNLRAMTASAGWFTWVGGILFIFLMSVLIYRIFLRIFRSLFIQVKSKGFQTILLTILVLFLVIPIRGGLGISSLTISSAYFSQNQFANHAAINPVWNVAFSITESKDLETKYIYYSPERMHQLVQPLLSKTGGTYKLLNSDRPNIIIMIVESLTAKAVEVTGGQKGITPYLDSLAHEGILFNHVMASSDRTDKGIAAVIAGYYSLPGSSPLKYQKLTEKLPFLPAELNKNGYHSSFFYGGTLEFANYRSFLVQAGFSRFISDVDFRPEELASKWGAWDHIVMNRFLKEMPSSAHNFFSTILTLTSHEPFIIPIPPLLKGNDIDTKFLNSIHYTDKCIGDFIRVAKTRDWWKNTLVVIIADHGSKLPGNSGYEDFRRQHIPMIWIGGALAIRDTVITPICSQVDLASTLLNQLNIDGSKFIFSKNILSTQANNFAFYTFNEGFGFRTLKDNLIYNTVTNNYTRAITSNPDLKEEAKAYLQLLYSDFFRNQKDLK